MKASRLFCFVFMPCVSVAHADSSARRPDQFYTNGQNINAWTAVPQLRGRTTFWFARQPANSAAYRQMLAIIYDDHPDRVFYIDSATKMLVGRLDLNTDRFSLLPTESRRSRLKDIDEQSFPTPVALPRVSDLFDPLPSDERENDNRLLLPPPTIEFPRFEQST